MAEKYKVLVIDDEQGVTELLGRLLSREGYDVKTENDAVKGLELAKKNAADVVLLDIKMPMIDGMEVLAKIKEFDPKIGVIMITGYGSIESAMESIKMGAYDYITKPFDINFIKLLVKKCIEESHSLTR